MYTGAAWLQRNSKLHTANGGESAGDGVGVRGTRAVSRLVPGSRKEVQKEGRASKGETESSLSVLVFLCN